MENKILKKVKRYIEQYQLIQQNEHIIVGVSGGADSIALLDLLYRLKEDYNITIEVAHVHHGARVASDEEEEYVRQLAKTLGIDCHVHHCDINQLAQDKKISEEVAGREERYNFFISLTNESSKIATAHTINDQAETMLMRFFRGADVKGLNGIPKKRQNIIRPILCLSREEVEAYCEARTLKYYNDESNFTRKYTRNKIRIDTLPYIKQNINPNIIQTLANHAELYQEEEDFFKEYVDKLYKECAYTETNQIVMQISFLQQQKPYIQKRLFLKAVESLIGSTKDLTLTHLNQCIELLNRQSGKCIDLVHGLTIRKRYDEVSIQQRKEEVIFTNYESRLELGINNIEWLDAKIICNLVDRKTFEQSKENIYTKYIDYDKIKDTLRVRTKRVGDLIILENGSKKVKKLFIDEKVPSNQREQIPIIINKDEIVWVVGIRLGSPYYVTEQTKRILEIKILNKEVQEGLC